MALFQTTVVQKYLKAQDQTIINEKWETYKAHFHNPSIQENVRNAKEEQYQEGFLRDLFVNVLGYTLNPETNFNLTTELKNVKDAKKADGGILVNDKVVGVIELKGTDTTDLSKVESQAFGYKNNQKNCTYVITSNFEKLRFYVDNAIEHQAFDLFQLTEKDFKLLYLCLAYENISKDIPKKLKSESLSQEDVITKQLYKDYSLFKRELFNNLTELNPNIDPLLLFKKSQKLLDRFLFLFFAEDRHLLPPNSVRLVLQQWKKLKELDAYTPLFERYKKYFGYLNTGYKGKKYDVYPYNGGLFKPDDILDNIEIDDDLLYLHTLKLSEYDFDSEVDVNILGHIFENSLNEIEEIQTQLEEDPNAKPKVSKRKKDGVFYTPKYITKYIVENTVGKLCEERKESLAIVEEEYNNKRQKKTKETLLGKLKTYRQWLLQLTIVDPACGSGAFLNEALNYLIAEHQYIDELETKLMGGGFVFPNVENSILENNLFGVDINNESVEIAKLSLWLRTAQPNRKLNDLSHNIKCGNSLIDDPEVAGDKAFNWETEFPKVFAKGGFDVVIGNPPYIRVEFISKKDVEFYKNNYVSSSGKFDLSSLFFEKSVDILRNTGVYSVITSYQFIYTNSGLGLRKFITKKTSCTVLMFSSDSKVFQGATTYAGIFIARKGKSDKVSILIANNELQQVNTLRKFALKLENFSSKKVIVADTSILEKINNNKLVVKGNEIGFAKTGVVTSADDVFYLTAKEVKNYNLEEDFIYPIIGPVELHKWFLRDPETFCIYTYKETDNKTILIPLIDLKTNYNSIYSYLQINKDRLISRSQGRKDYSDSHEWHKLNRPREKWIYDSPKLIYPGTTDKPKFAFDQQGQVFRNARVYSYILKSNYQDYYKVLMPILNSSLSAYFMSVKCPPKANNYYEMSTSFMDTFPFILPKGKLKNDLRKITEHIVELSKKFYDLNDKYKRSLQREFPERLEKLPKKLQNWHELSFADFVKELKKKKIKLSLSQKAEWEDYFLAEQQKALDLQAQINATDNEIDQMVYELYGLTEEEIEVVENS